MSQSTETEQTTAQARKSSGANAGPDLDAEHRPDVARRASLASLKRFADAGGDGGKASLQERDDESKKANAASVEAVNNAATLATKRIMALDSRIKAGLAQAQAGGEAGMSPLIQELDTDVNMAGAEAERLGKEAKAAVSAGVPMEQIQHSLAMFDRAYGFLTLTVQSVRDSASKEAAAEGSLVSTRLFALNSSIQDMYHSLGWKGGDSGAILSRDAKAGVVGSTTNGDPTKLLSQALDANLAALIEGTHATQMNLDNMQAVREPELQRTISHLNEVAHLVETGEPKTIKSHQAKIASAVSGFQHLMDQIKAPHSGLKDLVSILDQSGAERTVQKLKAHK